VVAGQFVPPCTRRETRDAEANNVRKVVIPVAVVALALGVWLITKESERGPAQGPSTPAPVVPAPENGSTTVGDDARAIVAPDEPAAISTSQVEPPVLTPMEQKAQSARALQDPELTSIEMAFAAEPVDPLWATGVERNILGQLAQANLQLVTMQVECRTSMCRVQLMEPPSKSPDTAAFRDLVRGFGLDVWRMQNLGNQSGAATTVAYLARPGDCYHGKDRSVCREPTP
jgi:hypothetical protein